MISWVLRQDSWPLDMLELFAGCPLPLLGAPALALECITTECCF